MTTVLLLVIFVGYIGLGVPDSLLGAAWPAIYADLNLPMSYVNFITVIIQGGTVISSFSSAYVIKKFGTAKTALISTAMTAVALGGFSVSKNIVWLCASAIPLGLGAGSIDTALNNFVAMHYKASHINFLHTFYGIGVSLSPYIMSIALKTDNNWRLGYRNAFLIQTAITVFLFLTMSVWNKVRLNEDSEKVETRIIKIKDAVKISGISESFIVFMASCTIESLCLVWGSTFLVEARGFSADRAAKIITMYFVGIALGRFTSGLISSKVSTVNRILLGQGITLVAVILMMLRLPMATLPVALFLVGFGNGSIFPNMTHLTPINFGKDISQSVIGMQMGFACVSVMLTPILFGFIAQNIGVWLFPYCMLAALAVLLLSTIVMIKKTEKAHKATDNLKT